MDHEGRTIDIEIRVPSGTIEIICDYTFSGRALVLENLHIQGLFPGALGRSGLNALAREIMEQADVDILEIHGAIRTTGRKIGRRPSVITARRRIGR